MVNIRKKVQEDIDSADQKKSKNDTQDKDNNGGDSKQDKDNNGGDSKQDKDNNGGDSKQDKRRKNMVRVFVVLLVRSSYPSRCGRGYQFLSCYVIVNHEDPSFSAITHYGRYFSRAGGRGHFVSTSFAPVCSWLSVLSLRGRGDSTQTL